MTSELETALKTLLENQLYYIEKYVWHALKQYVQTDFYSSYCSQDCSDTTLINLAYLIYITFEHKPQIARKQFDSLHSVIQEMSPNPDIQVLYTLLSDYLNFYDISQELFSKKFLEHLVTL